MLNNIRTCLGLTGTWKLCIDASVLKFWIKKLVNLKSIPNISIFLNLLVSSFLDGVWLSLNRGCRPPACRGPLAQKAVATRIVNARLSVAGTFRPAWGLGESSELTQDRDRHTWGLLIWRPGHRVRIRLGCYCRLRPTRRHGRLRWSWDCQENGGEREK